MELRKHYFLDRWVVIAAARAKRPKQFHEESHGKEGTCFFCPGNEHTTPPEIGRIPLNDSWKFRWFPNKFPAVEEKGNPNIETHNKFFTFASSYGHHEVIAETPEHDKQLWDLSREDMAELFLIYKNRIEELSEKPNIKYVTIFKNHGAKAGTSLIHSHTQIVGQNHLPTIIEEKLKHSKDSCPYCEIIEVEKNSDRRCFENESFIAFTPYASRFNYEIWLMPKKHISNLTFMTNDDVIYLSDILKKILDKLKELNLPYNYYLQYAPKGESLHFHIEVIPRLATWAGYEYATETIINSVSPEDAAKYYRGEI